MTIPLTMGDNTVTLTPANPVAHYSITVDSPIKIYSSGSYDTYCTLSNIIEQTWTYDDEGVDANFELTISVSGDYFLDITLFGGAVSETTTFTVTVEPYTVTTLDYFEIISTINPIGFYDFELVAQLPFTDIFNFQFDISNTQNVSILLTISNIGLHQLDSTIPAIRHVFINSDIGVISTNEINMTAIIPMTSRNQFDFIAPVRISSDSIKMIEITAIIRLLENIDSIVVDINKPETPKHGTYS